MRKFGGSMDTRTKQIVLDSIRDPRKSNTIISPEEIPSVEQEVQLRKYIIPLDVDAPIQDAVIELNQKGLVTGGSCCGHSSKNPAYITFDTILTKKELQRAIGILRKHGLLDVKEAKPAEVNIRTAIDFRSIPTPSRKWWTPEQAMKTYSISMNEYNEAIKASESAPREDGKVIIDKLLSQRSKAQKEGDQETVYLITKGILSFYKAVKERKLSDIVGYIESKALPLVAVPVVFKGNQVKRKSSVKSRTNSATIRVSRNK